MDQFFDKVAKVPQAQKIALVAMLIAAVCGVYYSLFYTELEAEKEGLRNEKKRLEKERADYEARQREFIKVRDEVQRLLEEEKELLRVLPTRQELPTLLESIHAQAELVGLDIKTFSPGGEQPVEMYFRIPVGMSVSGTYHQLMKFFKNLSELKRIVNVEGVGLGAPRGTPIVLNAGFTVVTYRFQDRK